MPDNVALLATIERIRNNLIKLQNQKMIDMARVYRNGTARFDADIELIAQKIAEGASKRELMNTPEYRRLIDGTAKALQEYSAYLTVDLQQEGQRFVQLGYDDSVAMLRAETGDVAAVFRGVPQEALDALGRYADPGKPLYKRLQELAPQSVDNITNMILDQVGKGLNPVTIAKNINNAYGLGLTDALRMMRTVQIYSYRDASHINYQANSDVVRGWVWNAKLDDRTCMSCVAQHGSFHSVDEKLNDHHNGRCVAVPVTIMGTPFAQDGDGEKWFRSQPEGTQKIMMGEAKYQAWKDGAFSFDKLSTVQDNDVFGKMRTEASLKRILEDK